MSEKNKIVYQTVKIVVPAGTTINANESRQRVRFTPDSRAKKCTGVVVYINTAPNIIWRVGLKNDEEFYQGLTHWKDWVTETNVGQRDRYKVFDFPVFTQNQITIMVDTLETVVTELSVDVVFRYES
jgi:hypothetical protein